MEWIEALIMGIFQGLTEFLPVSSSGHLALAGNLLGVEDPDKILTFTIAVHVATVMSTLVILWKEVAWIFKGLFNNKFCLFVTHFVNDTKIVNAIVKAYDNLFTFAQTQNFFHMIRMLVNSDITLAKVVLGGRCIFQKIYKM